MHATFAHRSHFQVNYWHIIQLMHSDENQQATPSWLVVLMDFSPEHFVNATSYNLNMIIFITLIHLNRRKLADGVK